MQRVLLATVALSFLAACLPGDDLPLAQTQVAMFHDKLNAGAFAAIYQGAGPDMKAASAQADFVQLLSAVHRKLGAFQSASAGGWNDNATTSGHFLTLNFAAKFERGSAQENFVYRIDGGHALLAGYHITSNALIIDQPETKAPPPIRPRLRPGAAAPPRST